MGRSGGERQYHGIARLELVNPSRAHTATCRVEIRWEPGACCGGFVAALVVAALAVADLADQIRDRVQFVGRRRLLGVRQTGMVHRISSGLTM
jgi:hypothetical protein